MSEMSITLDRFPAPPVEPDPVAHCAECGEELHAGEDVVEYDGEYFCCDWCVLEFLRTQDVLHNVRIGENA
jgi:hypothetical protein